MDDFPKHYEIADTEMHCQPWNVCAKMTPCHTTREEAIAAATDHANAVIRDSPEIAALFDLLGRARWELWRACRSPDTIQAIDDAFIAAKRDIPSPGPSEPVPDELAKAREKILALEAERPESGWAQSEALARMARMELDIDGLRRSQQVAVDARMKAAGERDAALIRVAELDSDMSSVRRMLAAAADGDRLIYSPDEIERGSLADLVEILLGQRTEYRNDAMLRLARVQELEGTAHPKTSSESAGGLQEKVEVLLGPDYVTRSELIEALRGSSYPSCQAVADRLVRT